MSWYTSEDVKTWLAKEDMIKMQATILIQFQMLLKHLWKDVRIIELPWTSNRGICKRKTQSFKGRKIFFLVWKKMIQALSVIKSDARVWQACLVVTCSPRLTSVKSSRSILNHWFGHGQTTSSRDSLSPQGPSRSHWDQQNVESWTRQAWGGNTIPSAGKLWAQTSSTSGRGSCRQLDAWTTRCHLAMAWRQRQAIKVLSPNLMSQASGDFQGSAMMPGSP